MSQEAPFKLPLRTDPAAAGFHAEGIMRAYDVVRRFVEDGSIPGAAVMAGTSKAALPPVAFGYLSIEPGAAPVTPETIYDCASLTKVVVTATLALLLLEEGRFRLASPLAYWIPEFGREEVTLFHLLTHTSGLPAWSPLYEAGAGKDRIVRAVCETALEREPGTAVAYSCLGFILLGEAIERESGISLDALARERIFAPLGMEASGYLPDPSLFPRIAPTERAGETFLHGVVHDENARVMGGVSGNAGLFSTAGDLGRFAFAMARSARAGESERAFLSPATAALAVRNHTEGLGEARGLGWQLRGESLTSPAGDLFSPESFGHTGFTGTSLWIDPKWDLWAVLLTNRVHPTRENTAHLRLRPMFHNALAAARRGTYVSPSGV